MKQEKRIVADGAVLMRVRTHLREAGGLHFRRPGHDLVLRDRYGSWFAINDRGNVARSAAADGHPAESVRDLARRLELLAAWEQ